MIIRHDNGAGQSASTVQRIPLYVAGKAKPVCHVDGLDLIKHLLASKHFLKKPPAIAFDTSILDDAEAAGAVQAVVFDDETGTIYTATLALVRSKGFAFNRGFGDQTALTLNHWQRKSADEQAEQLAMFGEA